jgi:hypothetical protein
MCSRKPCSLSVAGQLVAVPRSVLTVNDSVARAVVVSFSPARPQGTGHLRLHKQLGSAADRLLAGQSALHRADFSLPQPLPMPCILGCALIEHQEYDVRDTTDL